MSQRNIEEFENNLTRLNDRGCQGVAFFTKDSNDVTTDELAQQANEHAKAILDVVEGGDYRSASSLGL